LEYLNWELKWDTNGLVLDPDNCDPTTSAGNYPVRSHTDLDIGSVILSGYFCVCPETISYPFKKKIYIPSDQWGGRTQRSVTNTVKKKRVSPPAIRKSGSNKNNTAPIMKFPMIVIKPAFAPIEKKRKSPKY